MIPRASPAEYANGLLDPGSIYQAISAWLALVPKTSSPEEMEVKREEVDAMHRSCAA
jgi:hypothetical protein